MEQKNKNSALILLTRKGLSCLVLFILSLNTIHAQQEWLYSQAQFNIFDLNGAYAGNYDELSIALRMRQQWVGFEGAPQSQYLSMHLPIIQNLGGGIRILNESLGARSRQKLTTSLSFKLPLKSGFLGFGLNAGVLRQQFLQDRIEFRDPSDASIENYSEQDMLIHFDASILWYSTKYYLGVEIQNLNEPSFKSQAIIDMQQTKHVVLIGAYVFEINDKLAIKPTTRLFLGTKSKLLMDVNLNFLLYQKIWLGAGWRKNLGYNFFTEWNVTPRFRVGYSYDYNKTEGFSGSHEIFLGFHIRNRKNSANSIRYFK